MQTFCNTCQDYTEQTLLKTEVGSRGDEYLLTTYRCHICNEENYGSQKRSEFDTTEYPIKPVIPPERLESAIKSNQNWKPRYMEFKIENGRYYIGEEFNDNEIEFEEVSKEEYNEEKFEHKYQLRYHEAKRGESIVHWEYPPKNYQINEECESFGHDYEKFTEYEDQYGIETFPEFMEDPKMIFVGSNGETCSRCRWISITVYPDKARQWYFRQKEI